MGARLSRARLTRRQCLAAALCMPFVARPAFANDLHRLIGPMLMLGFAGRSVAAPDVPWIARLLERGEIGGVVFLGHNFSNRADIEALTRLFRAAPRERPALIAVDQEGGAVQRLSSATGYRDFPAATKVARGSEAAAAQLYSELARTVRNAGFNLNLGPVVDLATAKQSPIIARQGRAYSKQGADVARFAHIFCQAHKHQHVLTTLKHFPGHGGASMDSHKAAADVTRNWSDEDLGPYRTLFAAGLGDVVMTGHLAHADLGGAKVPTSLSRSVVTDLLKSALAWKGPVLTDDLEMAPIQVLHAPAAAAVVATIAGNDLLMFSNTVRPDQHLPQRIVSSMRSAILDATLTLSRLEDANDRIQRAIAGITI